jgi:hypothetical protein
MALPASSSEQDLVRLLDLFPVKCLKEAWPDKKGTKEEICKELAGERELERIAKFLDDYFNFCKQHVHVFKVDSATIPNSAGAAKLIRKATGAEPHGLYTARVKYTVVLRDPFQETTVDFLWPLRIDIIGKQQLLLRFVVLEKDIGTRVNRPVIRADRSLDEPDIIEPLQQELDFAGLDLNKGVKKLWSTDYMDARRTNYKKPNSTAWEAMDEARGIKKDNPELYALLMRSPLYDTLFIIPATENRKEVALWIDPTRGTIRFPRYAENMGDTDNVIREILKKNS